MRACADEPRRVEYRSCRVLYMVGCLRPGGVCQPQPGEARGRKGLFEHLPVILI